MLSQPSWASATPGCRPPTDAGLACAELHPRGALILAGSEQGDLLVFATSNGNLLQRLVDPSAKPSPITSVAWAQIEGVDHVVAGHKNGSVRIWRLDRAAVVASLAAHRSDVGVLAVMPPLALLATGGADGNIKLWQLPAPEAGAQHPAKPLALKEPRQKLKGHAGELMALHFTPDGEQLISGDSQGGLRVWEVAGGAPKAGRLAHNLSGHHSGAVSGLACHPDERLFVSCSADRTLRVWDMDGLVPSCINTYGPEGRREPRAVAFTPGGRALLVAYPDGLRTFTLDPLQLCDTADGLQWGKVRSIRYLDGKVVGLTLFKGDAGLHCIDLTRMKPFAAATTAAAAVESAARCAAAPAAPAAPAVPLAAAATSPLPATPMAQPAAGVPQPGPGAGMAAQQQRQVLEARTTAANGKGPAIEVHAPPLRHARHATFTSAAPSGRAPAAAGSATPHAASGSQAGEGRGGRPPRVSAEENGGGAERRSSFGGSKAELPSDSKFVSMGQGAAGEAGAAQQASGQPSPPSMLALSSERGFQLAALEGSRQLCARLQASRALLREVKALLQRGDMQGAVRKLKDAGDLCVASRVLASRVLQTPCPDRFTIELCAEAAPLCCTLLASPAAVHQQAALGLLDAVLGRWGDYMRGALSPAPSHRKVDIAAETRQQRSRVLQAALQTHVVPELGRLAAAPLGGGRAQQMLARIKGL
ncbi:katanin p80 WD40 repeat-containing subunit B1 [Chlorella sorokiniana]|uniref:Katanin p80 WD40 repeat-containing subunit B1 n=1 Tax=Chlorella sorokiniana TaxID=3076 RepID=A0A2P6TFI4_CHLSO|nr:katanin p80 WD40 repeat-containing subunit B1 [Chlorella sorokiniana]|eukprot:PRW32885.1 katanin p80 WD40 repeat-containing subunit B1 [Chlorella sorokiniana]